MVLLSLLALLSSEGVSSENVLGVLLVTLLVGRYTDDRLVYLVLPVSEVHFSRNHLWSPVSLGFFGPEYLPPSLLYVWTM